MVFDVECLRVLQSVTEFHRGVGPEDEECYNTGVNKGEPDVF